MFSRPASLHSVSLALLLLPWTVVALAGCSRPQPTADQVAGPGTPADYRMGTTPSGGPSEAPTGAGAGGSAAAGYENGRVGSTVYGPTLPEQKPGIDQSRMSPVGSSGSGNGDRGNPIPPDVSLAVPPDPGTGTARTASPPVSNPTAAGQPAASQAGAINPVVLKPLAATPPTIHPAPAKPVAPASVQPITIMPGVAGSSTYKYRVKIAKPVAPTSVR